MTAHAAPRPRLRRKSHSLLLLLLVLLVVLIAGATTFVSYMLWPTWPTKAAVLDAPAVPVTVAGVLFNIPPSAIRAPVQRHPGAHERIDLVFPWPSLAPPSTEGAAGAPTVTVGNDGLTAAVSGDRLFVTIAGLGAVLAPAERLRSVYPRYFETEATDGPDGLAVLPFRAGTPYEGEDLIYFAEKPETFFVRCTRAVRSVPGTCVQERVLDAADIAMRFPRQWLQDWRSIAGGFDRLVGQLHPKGG
ncbi:MAG: hypothetical protein ACLPX7_29870 [Xanthobacteraceae bacterium]